MGLIEALQDKDDKKAYALAQKIIAESAGSDAFYCYLDDFLGLLGHGSSFVRARGCVLACAQAKWDAHNRLNAAMSKVLCLLHDDKPTVARQCLAALHEVAAYKPELRPTIRAEIGKMDLSRYKDSMAPLLEKDRLRLLDIL
jgi:hypothetical protein